MANTNLSPATVRELSEAQAAWIGAIIEGEGCIALRTTDPRAPICEIRVGNTDVEVIATCLRFVGAGTVHIQQGVNRPVWCWKVSRTLDVLCLAEQIIPWMTTKGEILQGVLQELRDRRGR